MKRLVKIMAGVFAVGIAAAGFFTSCGNSNKVTVGIVLPTKDEPRWIQDEKQFTKLLSLKNIGMQVLFSQGDSNKKNRMLKLCSTKALKFS